MAERPLSLRERRCIAHLYGDSFDPVYFSAGGWRWFQPPPGYAMVAAAGGVIAYRMPWPFGSSILQSIHCILVPIRLAFIAALIVGIVRVFAREKDHKAFSD